MALKILLLEEKFGTRYDKKNVKGEKIEASGDVSCPAAHPVQQAWVGIKQSGKSKRKTRILKPTG